MLKKELIYKNPLRIFDINNEKIIESGEFGAVLARAGVGKTALLVQIALNSLLSNKNVLHISLNDPISKVCLWYEEVFRHIASQMNISQTNELWETILLHRFIMTFQRKDFSEIILNQRISELSEQGIFYPQVILIDGYCFEENRYEELSKIKKIAENHSSPVWFTIRTHRHEETDHNGFPPQFSIIADYFKVAVQIKPEGDKIQIKLIKGSHDLNTKNGMLLDPTSMLIK